MPTCCVKNCTSRTHDNGTKGLKYFSFPSNVTLREQWLKACQKMETDMKVDSARVCSLHFDEDCFEWVKTQPRLKNAAVKEILKLKKESIPSKMLCLEKKRKRMLQSKEDNERIKVLTKFHLPTYKELIQYARENQLSDNDKNLETNVANRNENIEQPVNMEQSINMGQTINMGQLSNIKQHVNMEIKEQNEMTEQMISHEISNNVNVSIETLIQQLKKSEKEKQKLLEKNFNLEEKNQDLNEKVMKLQAEVTKMAKDNHIEAEAIAIKTMQKVFTPGQIKMLMFPTKSFVKWCPEDIISAISLRSLSPKAYRYLRNVKKIPLPCATTLQNWVANFNVLPGILHDSINIMLTIGQNLSIIEKLTVLSFDELYISNKLDIERKQQKVYGPHTTCQFVMARGLFKNWRQPVYYDFDTAMSHDILLKIIKYLYEADYIVVAVVCDMGPSNIKLWKELNIGINNLHNSKNNDVQIEKQCFIIHPANNSLRIFFYADVPHLLKLARNNFIDSGFRSKETLIDKICLEKLLSLNERDLKISHKLSRAHLDAKGTQRQKVKLAAQLFSNKNAVAIEWCGQNNLMVNTQWKRTSEVLKLFNDWFDLFNSTLKYGHNAAAHAYGINLQEQNKIINSMNEFIEEMRIGQRKTLLQFQKGILLCNKSLQQMFIYLKETYSSETLRIDYILTRRLNQDILENSFSYLRSMGGGYDHPTPVEIQHHLKWYILGKHSGHVISTGKNTEGDSTCESLITIMDVHNPDYINSMDQMTEDDICMLQDIDDQITEKDIFIPLRGNITL